MPLCHPSFRSTPHTLKWKGHFFFFLLWWSYCLDLLLCLEWKSELVFLNATCSVTTIMAFTVRPWSIFAICGMLIRTLYAVITNMLHQLAKKAVSLTKHWSYFTAHRQYRQSKQYTSVKASTISTNIWTSWGMGCTLTVYFQTYFWRKGWFQRELVLVFHSEHVVISYLSDNRYLVSH